jgi:Uma2 family endonuclease
MSSKWYPSLVHHYTYREYLELEEMANVRHEFLGGEIFAMAGGSRAHSRITVNVAASLHEQLRGKRCTVHSSDMKIRVLETGLATYPDVSVVCGTPELDPESEHVIVNPTVIVEVLSPGTEEWDRGGKLEHYKRVESLREVVLVAHDRRAVAVWRRDGESWSCTEVSAGSAVLASIGCSLALADIYYDPLAAD